ncbi:glycine oxidase ThiO [Salibacterium salarium]|uniref:glycine oxidase n=1 Tax=Salibacterium salarium TaxID=284579 RepID=A0A3R9RGI4_9BACI|nr:glycine oxidase ThiO [Salibacterium salarium]RSL34937.1 glycine oxidase ThiO [Salibacterium salarium]
MNNFYDVLVIGGGVNGCSIAYQCSKRNMKVAVLEKTRVGAEASSAAAGMLGAQAEIKEKSPFFDFARKSRDMFPKLVPELEEKSGTSVSLIKNGMLKIADSETEKNRLLDMLQFQQQEGEQVEWLTNRDIQAIEPSLTGENFGGLYIRGDGQVKAAELTKAYARAATFEGCDFYEDTPVLKILQENGRAIGAETPFGPVYADEVVLASGAWSNTITSSQEQPLPLIPVKGECVSLRPARTIIQTTMHASDFYLVPKPGGSIIIGATEREGEMGKKVSAGAVQTLLAKAFRLVPDLQEAEWETAWTGVRPQTFDGKPYLGQSQVKGLWIAAGHYRNGILLSALTGTWMADLIEGKANVPEWISAFSPQRTMNEKEDTPVDINN